ncbi:MAG: hypothetical protein LUD12_11435 [Lachnospiraceae bacterium]|nr:hypothetical protein [Lachnospiraceae bacterium]
MIWKIFTGSGITQIQVQCEDGKLTITRMDAETAEAQMPACCAAEKEVRYGRGNK